MDIFYHTTRSSRRVFRALGFSLVELLVVIGIIGVLIALLLPAVQAARESARRTQCQNNLKQIGLALHGYHLAHQAFPRGGWPLGSTNPSWASAVLPGLEEQALYDQLNRNVPYTDLSNLAAGRTIVPVFICPSSHRDSLWRKPQELPTSSTQEYARSDYGAVNGERGLRSPTATNKPERGVLIQAGNISLAEIRDGSSKTILVGEEPEGHAGIWLSVRNILDQSAPINTLAPPGPFAEFVFPDSGMEISSYHTDGAYTLFADGAVHFLTETLDPLALAAFCSRDGGETVETPY